MNFEDEIILENEVAILRPLTIEDTQLLQGFVLAMQKRICPAGMRRRKK